MAIVAGQFCPRCGIHLVEARHYDEDGWSYGRFGSVTGWRQTMLICPRDGLLRTYGGNLSPPDPTRPTVTVELGG
jgi:ribosomal protein S27AE